MAGRNQPAAARRVPTAHGTPNSLARIKIEDEDDYEVPEIDLTGLDDDQEGVDAIRDITPEDEYGGLPFGCIIFRSTQLYGETVWPGDNLQLDDGSFLHGIRIFRDISTGSIVIDGNLLKRMKHLNGMLAKNHVNEVCLVLRAPAAGKDATLDECRTSRPLSAAVCKRKIIFTNQVFPAYSVYDYPYYPTSSLPEIREHAQLVCRWRFTEETVNAGSKVTAGSLMTLSEEECDEFARASDVRRHKVFLSEKRKPSTHDEATQADEQNFINLMDHEQAIEVRMPKRNNKRFHTAISNSGLIDLTGGSDQNVEITKRKITETIKRIDSTGVSERRISITTTESTRSTRTIKDMFSVRKSSTGGLFSSAASKGHNSSVRQRYTFGDLCTGGGGMASGAKQAGFKMNFLLDHWEAACKTLSLNVHTHILLKSIFDFCDKSWEVSYANVDVLHISFPCQPHSPVHTVPGRNDEANIATGYSVGPILEKCKPRIVTFEQTSGIVTHGDGSHFHALIRQITDAGYSLRWKICNLAEYGNVQPRKRLIIIAACPSEILPLLPEPTHGLGPGKLPFVTIHNVLQKARNAEVPLNLRHFTRKDAQPYNSRQPMKGCITCDGGASSLHPTGKRTFTLFELALLQGFPTTHKFSGTTTDIRKQIGNAVPSMFAKALFEHVTQSLQKSDARNATWKPETIELLED